MPEPIEPSREQVLDFCSLDPVERVFLEDVARRGLGRFLGLPRADRSLAALCHVGANLVPSGEGCAAFAEAGARAVAAGRSRMLIGAEHAVGELWEAMEAAAPAPRENRAGQPVYALDEPPRGGETGLRAARLRDLEALLPACAAAHELELGTDPLAREPESFRRRTLAQIEDGRSWLWREGDTILFKAEAAAWTPSAVQVQQVWVDPSARGRGIGLRGMRDLARLLLERAPTVTLFVRSDNLPAIRLYEALGMRRALTYRSVLL